MTFCIIYVLWFKIILCIHMEMVSQEIKVALGDSITWSLKNKCKSSLEKSILRLDTLRVPNYVKKKNKQKHIKKEATIHELAEEN